MSYRIIAAAACLAVAGCDETPAQVYLVQIGLVFCGLLFSLYAMHRVSRDLLGDREAAFAAFLPMAGLAFLLTLLNLWSLAVGLL